MPPEESMLPPADADTGSDAEKAATPENKPADGEQSPWLWNEDAPGTGDKPEWLNDKYKSVADQAKAHTELEKKFGAFTGAPEEYEIPEASVFSESIELPEGIDFNMNPDDPLLKAFMPIAKEMGINQEGFNKMVGTYIQQQANDYADNMNNAAEQKKALGDDADQRLGNIARWAKANMDDEMYQSLHDSLTTADSVKAIEYLIGKTRNAPLPNPGDITPKPGANLEEAKRMQGVRDEKSGKLKIEVDKHYRAKVAKAFEDAVGTEPYRKVVG